MRKWVNDVTCGQSLASEWVAEHPHVQGLKDLYMFYDGKTSELEKKTPFRPHEDVCLCFYLLYLQKIMCLKM